MVAPGEGVVEPCTSVRQRCFVDERQWRHRRALNGPKRTNCSSLVKCAFETRILLFLTFSSALTAAGYFLRIERPIHENSACSRQTIPPRPARRQSAGQCRPREAPGRRRSRRDDHGRVRSPHAARAPSMIDTRHLACAGDLARLDFAKSGGTVTVVAQDASTGRVLMVAAADRDALERTLAAGEMHFLSRRRGPWRKGETSGDVLRVVRLLADCDGDAVLALVHPATGIACHTGSASCFGDDAHVNTLATLDATIAARASEVNETSYTSRLLGESQPSFEKAGRRERGVGSCLRRWRQRTRGRRGGRCPVPRAGRGAFGRRPSCRHRTRSGGADAHRHSPMNNIAACSKPGTSPQPASVREFLR
jgi:phosphoribosyl-AMP cyclohydrolase / phosphoribosyl-ATP pyrophosphohydrolase